jgi:DNA polymerase III subunit epsilon
MLTAWLDRLLRRGSRVAQSSRPAVAQRWVVLDVETSGLDPSSDRLLAIGAVVVRAERIVVADSLELLVRQSVASSQANILVHGIGGQSQLSGLEPPQACSRFFDYAGTSVLVGFHSGFDRLFLARASKTYLGQSMTADWLDLAALAPALNPRVRAKALDEWLEHFGLEIDERHNACADAFATAMLFLLLLKQVPADQRTYRHLHRLSHSGRWTGAR